MTKRFRHALIGAAVAALISTPALADNFDVRIENPGVQNTTATFSYSGIETFDSYSAGGGQSFVSNFGTPGTLTGSYSNVDIRNADIYGGAGGTNFASTTTVGGYSLALATTSPGGINYFGFYLSALDGGNNLYFYNNGALVYTFTPTDVLALVNGNSAYYGNPDNGGDGGEPFAFLNFFDTDGTFDSVQFSQTISGGGYESDNHTVGFFKTQGTGTQVSGVPEPATWAMMLSGFGLLGCATRRRRVQVGFA